MNLERLGSAKIAVATLLHSHSRFPLPPGMLEALREVLDCVDRVIAGTLTDEELQNLCHNLTGQDHMEFMKGCLSTWQKLGIRVKSFDMEMDDGTRKEVAQ